MKRAVSLAIVGLALATGTRGQDLLRIGDVDADGLADVVMSTSVPGHELFAISAASGTVAWTHAAPSGKRGALDPSASPRLAPADDLDRDGRDDVAVVWICAQSRSSREEQIVAIHSAIDGRTLVDRDFEARRREAGLCALEAIGDFDGDGVGDLSFARWSHERAGARVAVLCGRSLRTLASFAGLEVADVVSTRCPGDLDGDGCSDAPANTLGWIAIGAEAGAAGATHRPLLARIDYEADDRAALLVRDPSTGVVERRGTIDGYDEYAWEEWRLESFVDFDRDGRLDFLLAKPGRGRHERSWCDDRAFGGFAILSADGATLCEVVGDVPLARLGSSLAAAGDVDRDGFEDVWAIQTRQVATPELLLFSGASGACIRRHLATTW